MNFAIYAVILARLRSVNASPFTPFIPLNNQPQTAILVRSSASPNSSHSSSQFTRFQPSHPSQLSANFLHLLGLFASEAIAQDDKHREKPRDTRILENFSVIRPPICNSGTKKGTILAPHGLNLSRMQEIFVEKLMISCQSVIYTYATPWFGRKRQGA